MILLKLFRNRFFLICLCIAVVLSVMTSAFALMGYGGLAKNIIGTVTMPVRWCVSSVANGIEGWKRYFTSIRSVSEKNDSLEEENRRLREELERAALLEQENERLRHYLGMKAQYPSFRMEEGMIISYSSGNYMTTFTLNRGTMHGVEKNMPVVTESGIVGYVTEAGLNWCMVSTVLETATSVGAYIPRSGVIGIVEGDYSMRTEGMCRMAYLETDADVKEGDRVLSSGTGSVYPAELVIGTVESVEVDEYNRTMVAKIRPAVDFSSLKWVMIVTGYEE
mgnify:CR=1 FL=1